MQVTLGNIDPITFRIGYPYSVLRFKSLLAFNANRNRVKRVIMVQP
jgi:hypothetical protein